MSEVYLCPTANKISRMLRFQTVDLKMILLRLYVSIYAMKMFVPIAVPWSCT